MLLRRTEAEGSGRRHDQGIENVILVYKEPEMRVRRQYQGGFRDTPRASQLSLYGLTYTMAS